MKLFTEFYPYGTQYHRAPTPLPEEWEGDIKTIAEKGYTHIQFRPQWRCHERVRGKYVWDDLDRLFDLAEKYNMKVVLKPMLENAPDYVFTKLGGTRIGFRGLPINPHAPAAYYVGGWLPCFDNPKVRKAAEKFVIALTKRYKDRESLWFYNAWNEPRSRPMGQCCCPHSVKHYQDWLKARYGTIENLNRTFGKEWESFKTIIPPHSNGCYVEMFLWRRWAAYALSEHVGLVADAIRKADPDAKVMCHVGASAVHQDPAADTSDDFLNFSKVDWYGTSMWIPFRPETPAAYNELFYQAAWLRRVDKNWQCHEFYPNQGNWWTEGAPKYVEQSILMTMASGARGLTFWQYRSERFGKESNGWGMRNIDGSPTPRSERCDRIAEFIANNPEIAPTEYKKPEVAVYYDIENDLLMKLQKMSITGGAPDMATSGESVYKNSFKGAHTTLRRMGYTADFVVNGDDLSSYKLVVVTSLEMTDEKERDIFQKYVENGGTLYIEYPFACRDERTWVSPTRPNLGFDTLTGCREAHRVDFSPYVSNVVKFNDGHEETAEGWHITLEPVADDVKVLANWADGGVALVERKVGKGRVIVSAGNFSSYAQHNSDKEISSVYYKLMQDANVEINESPVWVYSRLSDKYEYRFFFNTSHDDAVVENCGELIFAAEECTVGENSVTLPHQTSAIYKITL